MKQRDFPGNVRSGGCDSLPLVVAFTSKQRDSLLSYALHFLHILSHRMCCAEEKSESGLRAPVCGGKLLTSFWMSARKAGAFSEDCGRRSRASGESAFCWAHSQGELKREEKQSAQTSRVCIYHWSVSRGVFDMLFFFFVREAAAPRSPAATQVQPWTWGRYQTWNDTNIRCQSTKVA